MPNDDLTRAFAALSGDAGHARLAPAAAVRKRGDRQTLTRSLTGVAAAAVLVAGALVGSRLVLTDNALPPLPPGQSSAPTSAPPSVAPAPSTPVVELSAPPSADPGSEDSSPATETPVAPVIPKSIPDRAFLRSSDLNGGKPKPLSVGNYTPLKLCGAAPDYDSEDEVGIRARVEALYEDGRENYTPLSVVSESITVYRGEGAGEFVDEFRAMVRRCPAKGPTVHKSLGSLGVGDESQLVRSSAPATGDDGEPSADGSTNNSYHAVVRVGDTVLELGVSGYEAQSVERADAEALFRKAVQRLRGWRS